MPHLSSKHYSLPLINHTRLHFLPYPTSLISPIKTAIPTMSFSASSSWSSPSPSTTTNPKDDKIPETTDPEKLRQVLKYHNQTKHSFTNYARGPRGLDWANQPNPFRRYADSPLLPLLHFPTDNQNQNQSSPLYSSLFKSLPPPVPLSTSSISQLFYDSLALSAWKTTGFSTWSLRVNPSSGNLHPTESYLIAPAIESLCDSPFVAHYAPKEHGLELRAKIPPAVDFFRRFFPENSFLVGFSSIFWREAWKYGERAFRYCNHDVGHAVAAVAMAAAGLGWDVKLLDGLGHEDLQKLMGLDVFTKFKVPSKTVKGKFPDIEFDHPDCVLVVFPSGVGGFAVNYEELSSSISEFASFDWIGKPNLLSEEHICWDVIYRTAEAVEKPLTLSNEFTIAPFCGTGVFSKSCYKGYSVREIVRKRRSAVDMDGVTTMERDTFYQILLHCLPSGCGNGEKQKRELALPFRVLSWDAEVHAVLFVHRVKGLAKGLYFLVRNEEHFDALKKGTRPDFEWVKPEECPYELPLYLLAKGDCQQIAKALSCHQV